MFRKHQRRSTLFLLLRKDYQNAHGHLQRDVSAIMSPSFDSSQQTKTIMASTFCEQEHSMNSKHNAHFICRQSAIDFLMLFCYINPLERCANALRVFKLLDGFSMLPCAGSSAQDILADRSIKCLIKSILHTGDQKLFVAIIMEGCTMSSVEDARQHLDTALRPNNVTERMPFEFVARQRLQV
jgi:hypothetical protein